MGVAEDAGKIFGKVRARKDETKTDAETAQRTTRPPALPTPPAGVDRVHPAGRYGDNPGEKRYDVSDMVKPLAGQPIPSYKDGVDSVPETGPAILHKGEKVVPAKDNVMDKITGGVPAKVISHMVHRKHGKKHIVEHHHTRPEHHGVEHHHFSDMSDVHDHMEDHMGEPNPGEAEADGGQHGIPEGTPGAPPALPAGAPVGSAPAVGV